MGRAKREIVFLILETRIQLFVKLDLSKTFCKDMDIRILFLHSIEMTAGAANTYGLHNRLPLGVIDPDLQGSK